MANAFVCPAFSLLLLLPLSASCAAAGDARSRLGLNKQSPVQRVELKLDAQWYSCIQNCVLCVWTEIKMTRASGCNYKS